MDIYDRVQEILRKKLSEESTLDYKVIPYKKGKEADVIKDVVSMLNSIDGMGEDKFIIFGVNNKKEIIGLKSDNSWRDDTEWQVLFDKIDPRPLIATGTIAFEEKEIGYFCIRGTNKDWVYEIKEDIPDTQSCKLGKNKGVVQGQAFTRHGSANAVMMQPERELLKKKATIGKIWNGHYEITASARNQVFITSTLVGCWKEDNPYDRKLIETLSDMEYKEFIKSVQKWHSEGENYYIYDSQLHLWKCENHLNCLDACKQQIYNTDVLKLISYIENDEFSVFRECSCHILEGISETIAILANRYLEFSNCSEIKNNIDEFIDSIFSGKSYIYSIKTNEVFPKLAQASPKKFIKSINCLINNEDKKFFSHIQETGIDEWICRSLKILALDKNYFVNVMMLLLEMAIRTQKVNKNNLYTDYFIDILLPWCVNNTETVDVKKGMMRGFLERGEKYKETIWQILLKLIPGRVKSSYYIDHIEVYLSIDNNQKTYNDVSVEYEEFFTLLLEEINTENRIREAIELLPLLSQYNVQWSKRLLEKIFICTNRLSPEINKKVYFKIKSELIMEKKYSRLSEEAHLELINIYNKSLANIFEKDKLVELQWNFLRLNTLDEGSDKLCIDSLCKVYKDEGIERLIDILPFLEDKFIVGKSLASFLDKKSLIVIINKLKEPDMLKEIVAGIACTKQTNGLISYVDDDICKAAILCNCDIDDSMFGQIKKLHNNAESFFWTNIRYDKLIGLPVESEKIMEKLLHFGRQDTAIMFIVRLLESDNEELLMTEIIIKSLKELDRDKISGMTRYYLGIIMNWLYSKKDLNIEDMLFIEIKYLFILLDRKIKPFYWNKYLCENPNAFVKILRKINYQNLKYDDVIEQCCKDYNYCRKVLDNCYEVPGMLSKNNFDEKVLDSWNEKVVVSSRVYGVEDYAEYFIGRWLYKALHYEEVFFCKDGIGKFLNNKSRKKYREGFIDAVLSPYLHLITEDEIRKIKLQCCKWQNMSIENGWIDLYKVFEVVYERIID